jgi:serine/threonine-protein kinase
MSTVAERTTCPNCGSDLPAGFPHDLCARCLRGDRLDASPPGPAREGGTAVVAVPSETVSGLLESIAGRAGSVPCILLRDTDTPFEPPLVKPGHENAAEGSIRFRIDGEIARGGMGSVLKGRDPDLGRDVAIKVLREELGSNSEMVRRFVEEAQIGGQLQHPGIVPIYELGALADLRPFFAMKLVKGKTLATLLQARKELADDQPRLLGIFEQICQTVAYAQARGVIHRDLKPSNVMVGSFGEVQVMDWGLAKVLARGGETDDAAAGKEVFDHTVIATARTRSDDSDLSRAGSVLGTPSYMAPEQARGEVDRVNERADVFALGSILCEILSSRPAFCGRTSGEIQRKAALGDLADAQARLEACGADPELVALANDCLAREPEDRPPDAGSVSTRVTAHLTGVQERLRAAEVERARAEARTAEEKKRQKVTLALAASVVLTMSLSAGGWAFYARQRRLRIEATARRVDEALYRAHLALGLARSAGAGDMSRWTEAETEARQAQNLLAVSEADPDLRRRVATSVDDIQRGKAEATAWAEQAARDHALVARLEEVRARNADKKDADRRDVGYRAAFNAEAIDFDALAVADAAKALTARRVAAELAAALDDWAAALREMPGESEGALKLLAIAQLADPDPWRNRLREAIARNDKAALAALAGGDLGVQPVQSLVLLGTSLASLDQRDRAEAVLRDAQRRNPGDFWINYTLAGVLAGFKPPRNGEVIRFLSIAVAIRPTSILAHNDLGIALSDAKRANECLAEFREATRLWPENALLRENLANLLHVRQQLTEASALKREAITARPNDPEVYVDLADSLFDAYEFDAAIENCRKAISLKPDHGAAHTWLGRSLAAQARLDLALEELRLGVGLEPQDDQAHTYYGVALRLAGRLNESIAALQHAIELAPDAQNAMNYLGNALDDLGLFDLAYEQFTRSLALKPSRDEARHQMLSSLLEIGEVAKAEEVIREAERAVPDRTIVPHLKGALLLASGEPNSAVKLLETARREKPEGYRPDAVLRGEIERAIQLEPLVVKLSTLLDGGEAPADAPATAMVAELALRRGRASVSARLFRDAFAHDASLAEDPRAGFRGRAAFAAVRAGLGDDPDAPKIDQAARANWRRQGLDWFRAELVAWGKLTDAHRASLTERNQLVRTLRTWKRHRALAGVREAGALAKLPIGERDGWRSFWADVETRLSHENGGPSPDYRAETLALAREAVHRFPDSATAPLGLAGELARQGKLDDAMALYLRTARSQPNDARPHLTFAQTLVNVHRYHEAVPALREAIRLKPDDATAWNMFGLSLYGQEQYAEAAKAFQKAAERDVKVAVFQSNVGRALLEAAKFDEALAAFHRTAELLKADPPQDTELAENNEQIKAAERGEALTARLPAILRGNDRPRDDDERLTLAQISASRRLYAASTQFYSDVLNAKPARAGDLSSRHVYRGVRSAALAGCGRGADQPPLDDASRERLRALSLRWFRERLNSFAKLASGGNDGERSSTVRAMTEWRTDPDTAGVRDPEALEKLPAEERARWLSFWSDVASVLAKAQSDHR